MLRLLLMATAVAGATGCGGSSSTAPPPAPKPEDPHIRQRENIGGGVGPVSGARGREYEGPASQAPRWVKDQKSK